MSDVAKVSKSEFVRSMVAKTPMPTCTQVVDAAKAAGLEISRGLYYQAVTKLKTGNSKSANVGVSADGSKKPGRGRPRKVVANTDAVASVKPVLKLAKESEAVPTLDVTARPASCSLACAVVIINTAKGLDVDLRTFSAMVNQVIASNVAIA